MLAPVAAAPGGCWQSHRQENATEVENEKIALILLSGPSEATSGLWCSVLVSTVQERRGAAVQGPVEATHMMRGLECVAGHQQHFCSLTVGRAEFWRQKPGVEGCH